MSAAQRKAISEKMKAYWQLGGSGRETSSGLKLLVGTAWPSEGAGRYLAVAVRPIEGGMPQGTFRTDRSPLELMGLKSSDRGEVLTVSKRELMLTATAWARAFCELL